MTETIIVPKTETVAITDLRAWIAARMERITKRVRGAEAKRDSLAAAAAAEGQNPNADPAYVEIVDKIREWTTRVDELNEVARKLAWVECVGPISLKGA